MSFPRNLLQSLHFLHLQSTISVTVAVAGVIVGVPVVVPYSPVWIYVQRRQMPCHIALGGDTVLAVFDERPSGIIRKPTT